MHRHQALCLLKMGYACQAMGDYHDAIRHLTESLGIVAQLQLGHYAERARETLITCRDNSTASTLPSIDHPATDPVTAPTDGRPDPSVMAS